MQFAGSIKPTETLFMHQLNESLTPYWELYKELFSQNNKHREKYKWRVIKQVYNRWDWNASSRKEMFDQAFEINGAKNLWHSGNYYPVSHTKWMFHHYPDETESALNNLFDEERDLHDRIDEMLQLYQEKLPLLNAMVENKEVRNHYHGDRRAIALYLTLQYPEKYFLYKYTMFKDFCLKLGFDRPIRGRKDNLLKFLNTAEKVRQFIHLDHQFLESYRNYATGDNYADPHLHLLTQDFIYAIATHLSLSNKQPIMLTDQPLNQILFGPPGTGKTYTTIDKVVAIAQPNEFNPGNHKKNKEIFDQLIDEKRVSFVTFHQSMAYEDFVEGIKPVVHEKQVIYDVKDGLFKEICERAFSEIIALKSKETPPNREIGFAEIFEKFAIAVEKGLVQLKTISNKHVQFSSISAAGNLRLSPENSTQEYIVSLQRLEKLYKVYPDPSKIANISDDIREAIGGSNSSVFYAALKGYVSFEKQWKKEIEESGQELSLKDIRLTHEEMNHLAPYILVIDEINRGNVSAIFGELITLLEPDKRFGRENQLEIRLPYSKSSEGFMVPPNLYVIGTMNTADRSVEALDTALRRRFTFTEMLPKPGLISPSAMICRLFWEYQYTDWHQEPYASQETELFDFLGITPELENQKKDIWEKMKSDKNPLNLDYFADFAFDGIDLEELLTVLNRRIEVLIDRDHAIGHAWFINIRTTLELKKVFYQHIIPLLQEYFFGNYEKLELVLGEMFFDKQAAEEITFAVKSYSNHADQIVYQVKNVMTMDDDYFTDAIQELIGK